MKIVYINCKVTPRSAKSFIKPLGNNYYKIKLVSPPEKNRANTELISLLSAYFSVSKYDINIISGHTSPEKLVKITLDG